MRHPGRLWFRTRVGGADWQVRIASYDVVCRLAGRAAEACTDVDSHTIYIQYGLRENPSRLRIVTMHELLHATNSGPGDIHRVCKLLGCDEDGLDDREEDLCVHYAPLLVEALGGQWRLPRLPPR